MWSGRTKTRGRTKQSPSSEPSSCSRSQKIPCQFINPKKILTYLHEPLTDPIYLAHNSTFHLFKIHFNIVTLCTHLTPNK